MNLVCSIIRIMFLSTIVKQCRYHYNCQAVQVPVLGLSRSVPAEGKARKSEVDPIVFSSGEKHDLVTIHSHQVHIKGIQPDLFNLSSP